MLKYNHGLFAGTDASNLELDEVARRLVGKTLLNGAVVVDAAVRSNYFLVLAVRTDSFLDGRYVTWAVSPRDGEAFWGHYNDSLIEAVEDFRDRLPHLADELSVPDGV